jgi:general secretion pathway protein D
MTANFNLNSSDSRELDQMQLRLGDGETEPALGTRYPIQTSSFSSLSASVPNIPGLTGAGAPAAFSSLLSSWQQRAQRSAGGVPGPGPDPEGHPKVMRNDDVALTIEMKIDALSGTPSTAIPSSTIAPIPGW